MLTFFSLQKAITMLANRRPDVRVLQSCAKAVTEKTGSPKLQEMVGLLTRRFNTVETKLQERADFMEKVLEYINNYATSMEKVETDIPKLQDEILNLIPVSEEPDEVQEQLHQVELLQAMLGEDRLSIQAALDASDCLVSSCNPDSRVEEELRARVRISKEVLDDLTASINDRQNALKCALIRSREFKAASNDFTLWLNAVEDKLSSRPPVTSDVGSIRELKKETGVS